MTESLAKISSMLESAKDMTIEAAVSASSRLTDTPSSLRSQEISKLLNSRSDRDILNGMKAVILILSKGDDGLPFFADVVKNVTSPKSKIRNLVLIYLTRYAEVQPDTALLSINSIQKTLSDKSPLARATAIRSLGGIRIPEISSLLLLCIRRTIGDPAASVRSGTAIAIGKAYDIPAINKKQLFEYLCTLLSDGDVQVVGSALKTFYKIKEDLNSSRKKWDPIHGNFRRYTRILSQLDEWSQCYLIDIMIEYCRKFLPRPKLYLRNESNRIIDLPDNYSQIPFPIYDVSMDTDLENFLNSMKPLIYSRSEFVILSLAKAIYFLAPPSVFKDFKINAALCKLATGSNNSQIALFALQTIFLVTIHDKTIFSQYHKRFYLFPTDSIAVGSCKLQILSSLTSENNIRQIIEELKHYALTSNQESTIAKEAIKAIGRCSQISSYWNEKILKWCSKQIQVTGGGVLNELLTVIRYLIQQKQSESTIHTEEQVKSAITKTTYKLSLILQDDTITLESEAKASIIWIVGEFTGASNNSIAPDVLRRLFKSFSQEPEKVRYEILVLAAKVFTVELGEFKNQHRDDDLESLQTFLRENVVSKMFQHALHLAKYDSSYDTRDRARMFHVLLNTESAQSELASLFLQVPKPNPTITLPAGAKNPDIKSVSPALLEYFETIDWTADESTLPPASVRKEAPVKFNNLSSGGGNITSISSSVSRSVSPPVISQHAISSSNYHNRQAKHEPKETYRLQSLDEFFGNKDEDFAEESSEEDVDSSDEEEEDSEGSESEDDEEEDDHFTERRSSLSDTADEAYSSSDDANSREGFIQKSDKA